VRQTQLTQNTIHHRESPCSNLTTESLIGFCAKISQGEKGEALLLPPLVKLPRYTPRSPPC
ncbi:hypothetical protein NKJ95_12065, partial [Mesorhizobium sp. M0012]|uniref:hypothetical protein n=1 Tax=Mesorhizobium sp. M0012 TaxID=2956840 RepID=UPI00333D9B06